MREKYVEERFPRYFQFGEHPDGRVDLATSDDMTVCTVTKDEAAKLQRHRDAVIDMLSKMAVRFSEISPEEFAKVWYDHKMTSEVAGSTPVAAHLPSPDAVRWARVTLTQRDAATPLEIVAAEELIRLSGSVA